eukprot:77357_1
MSSERTEFVGRKTEILQVGYEDLLDVEQCKYICCCCYVCCKCLLKCRYKNYIPVFWTLLWILNGSIWIAYTSSLNLLPSIYVSITFIFTIIFSILSLTNVLIVLMFHPGPINIKWKNWNGELNTKPLIPIHSQTNVIVEMNDFEYKYCEICQHYKPLRTHHCSQCNICIDRMDHHCIWLNK